mmetsp:Transcript_103797/g.293469  ORF Transcript_103797/g.293469 Transcript_103797/m.293469 type:complete len:217 (-) Transcript_103797:1827-2477(-)
MNSVVVSSNVPTVLKYPRMPMHGICHAMPLRYLQARSRFLSLRMSWNIITGFISWAIQAPSDMVLKTSTKRETDTGIQKWRCLESGQMTSLAARLTSGIPPMWRFMFGPSSFTPSWSACSSTLGTSSFCTPTPPPAVTLQKLGTGSAGSRASAGAATAAPEVAALWSRSCSFDFKPMSASGVTSWRASGPSSSSLNSRTATWVWNSRIDGRCPTET